jgi:hypothetical protein
VTRDVAEWAFLTITSCETLYMKYEGRWCCVGRTHELEVNCPSRRAGTEASGCSPAKGGAWAGSKGGMVICQGACLPHGRQLMLPRRLKTGKVASSPRGGTEVSAEDEFLVMTWDAHRPLLRAGEIWRDMGVVKTPPTSGPRCDKISCLEHASILSMR